MSKVPEAEDRLLVLVDAWPALAQVRTSYSPPTEGADYARELIYLVSETPQEEKWIGLRPGQAPREEEFVLGLVITAYRPGDDQRAVKHRVWELRDEVAAAQRQDPTLGDLVLSAHVARTLVSSEYFDTGWGARATLEVVCKARV